MGKVHGLLHDLNELFPLLATPVKELEQCQTFFILMAVFGLPDDYSLVRDQILGPLTMLTLNLIRSTLLHVPCKLPLDIPTFMPPSDSSALVCHLPRPQCDH